MSLQTKLGKMREQFSNLLQNGIRVEILAGCTVKMLLCEDVNVEENYLNQ